MHGPNTVCSVKIQLKGLNILNLAEVEVFTSDDQNVAKGKVATQSSTSNYAGEGYPASRAVNGDFNDYSHTRYEQGIVALSLLSCKVILLPAPTYQSSLQGAWWKVDLEGCFSVARVLIHNRLHQESRLSHSTVSLLDINGNVVETHDIEDTARKISLDRKTKIETSGGRLVMMDRLKTNSVTRLLL
jgi:hypothetical protein